MRYTILTPIIAVVLYVIGFSLSGLKLEVGVVALVSYVLLLFTIAISAGIGSDLDKQIMNYNMYKMTIKNREEVNEKK